MTSAIAAEANPELSPAETGHRTDLTGDGDRPRAAVRS
jgi:hypothetical protein